jgi:hypothetical protein
VGIRLRPPATESTVTVRLLRASLALSGSLLLLRAASPAAAQLPLTRTDPDSLGFSADTVRVHADCQAFYRLDAFRSAKRREFRVRVLIHGGGCRGMLSEYEWLALPALPRGWSVRFTETDDRSEPFDLRRWIPLDASRN